MKHLFTSESVSEGHPDKVADQISDAILDAYLALDSKSRVACETLVTTDKVVVAGEISSSATINVEEIVRKTIERIGYNKNDYGFNASTCNIENLLHTQSPDISRWVVKENESEQWAWDQWIMFGYACNETPNFMPLSLDLSHKLLQTLAEIRRENNEIKYLRPDAKSQFTIEYEWNTPVKITDIVLSTQHDEFILPNWNLSQEKADEEMLTKIKEDVINVVMPRFLNKLSEKEKSLFNNQISYHINPTGKFVIWGPNWDTGLTWRKIIVDTYWGKWAHWWGAFSGKDSSKVDRSAAYMARYLAKNLVASWICNEVLIQLSYAIWIANPISIYVNSYWTWKINDDAIAKIIKENFDLRPKAIETRFNLRSPIYEETAAYWHFGRECKIEKKEIIGKEIEVELFPREKLDCLELFKKYL